MSMKLDKSLDEILTDRRGNSRRGRGGRRGGTRARTTAAPVGGVQKPTRTAKSTVKTAIPSGPVAGKGESKIIVSTLPRDVNEASVKEYFETIVGPVKRAQLAYGPNGQSRGIATVVFSKPGDANEAFTRVNGLLVDNRPMKVEVVLDPKSTVPAKGLGDRIAQPKNQPKSAVNTKATINGTAARGTGTRARARAGRRGRNAGRRKPKTADELDAEMTDYFAPGAVATDGAANANGVAQPTTNGGGDDLGMDEIS